MCASLQFHILGSSTRFETQHCFFVLAPEPLTFSVGFFELYVNKVQVHAETSLTPEQMTDEGAHMYNTDVYFHTDHNCLDSLTDTQLTYVSLPVLSTNHTWPSLATTPQLCRYAEQSNFKVKTLDLGCN